MQKLQYFFRKNRKKDKVPLDAARMRFGKAKGRIADA